MACIFEKYSVVKKIVENKLKTADSCQMKQKHCNELKLSFIIKNFLQTRAMFQKHVTQAFNTWWRSLPSKERETVTVIYNLQNPDLRGAATLCRTQLA